MTMTLETTYLIQDFGNCISIAPKPIDGQINGRACTVFQDYTIYYFLVNDIITGPAVKLFKDGSYIDFQYQNGIAEGAALKVSATGGKIEFIYRNGIATERGPCTD